MGPDDVKGGRVAGDLIGRFLAAAGGDVPIITGLRSMAGHRDRESGFHVVMREHFPACRVVAVEESRETAQGAGDVAAALRSHPGLKGIYLSSAGADRVVAALKTTGAPGIVFAMHELTDDCRALLRSREIHAMVDQDTSAEVQIVAEIIAPLLGRRDGSAPAPLAPVRIFTPESC